jgi:hypothetical protein
MNYHRVVIPEAGDRSIGLAGCCEPEPGDVIIGYVTSLGRHVSVHRRSCRNFKSYLRDRANRILDATWALSPGPAVVTSTDAQRPAVVTSTDAQRPAGDPASGRFRPPGTCVTAIAAAAAWFLPAQFASRYQNDYLEELSELKGRWARLKHALGLLKSASAMRRVLRHARPVATEGE